MWNRCRLGQWIVHRSRTGAGLGSGSDVDAAGLGSWSGTSIGEGGCISCRIEQWIRHGG